jgi:hypothetical protein
MLEQLLSTGGVTWRLRAMADRRGMRGRIKRGGAKAVLELPGDAWSGAGVGVGLGQRSNGGQRWCYCAAEWGGDPRVLSAVTRTTGTSL